MNKEQIERSALLNIMASMTQKEKQVIKNYFSRKKMDIKNPLHFKSYLYKFWKNDLI